MYWSFGELVGKSDCFKGVYVVGETDQHLGWNARKGECDGGILTPLPVTIDKGYSLQAVGSGPNKGLWFVKTVTYRMDTQSQMLAAIKSGSSIRWKTLDPTQQNDCTTKGSSITVSFFDFNVNCEGRAAAIAAMHEGIRLHEGYGRQNNSGHQAQLEQEALLPENDLYKVVEGVYGAGKDSTGKQVRLQATGLRDRLFDVYFAHTYVHDNWVACGDFWRWYPAQNKWDYNPILPGGSCL
jgi:hypothetical protein